jgi:predicted NBD/HSP70 family sugar kinase
MALAPEGAYFIGLKVGRRRTEIIVIDFVGNPVGQEITWHDYPTPEGTIAFAERAIAAQRQRLKPEQRERIAGLGIGLPFRLWEWTGALGLSDDAMAGWRDCDLPGELERRFGFPVAIENDSSAACNAELVFGTGDLPASFLYVFIGFFVGGGLVLNKALFKGTSGNAAALASMPVPDPDGHARQLVEIASLHELARRHDRTVSFWESTENWDAAPEILDAWIVDAARGLAHATTAAVGICDLDAVVIDGWLSADLRSRIVLETSKAIDQLNLAGVRRPLVLEGTTGPAAREIGAASLVLSSRFMFDPTASDQRRTSTG